MNISMDRFKLCDLRFHTFVKRVMERLPDAVRENVMNDRSFQIITDDDVFEGCVLRYEFGHPVKSLVYLNSKILTEPDHQIIHTIASEIAHHVLKKEKTRATGNKIDELLIRWGFGKEVDAIHFNRAICKSKGYKVGYDWAKKQSRDYLMQHFGLYFDEWNEKGLGRMSSNGLYNLKHDAENHSIIDSIVRAGKEIKIDPPKDQALEKLSLRKAILAGILTAIKESALNDFYCSKSSVPHHLS